MGAINLQGENIALRALEPEDLEFLFSVENDTAGWELSNTQAPFSKHIKAISSERPSRYL
jgi:diamine N-acetyltransferase